MLVDEVCDVVDAPVDDDVEAFIGRLVLGDFLGGECFGHFCFFLSFAFYCLSGSVVGAGAFEGIAKELEGDFYSKGRES